MLFSIAKVIKEKKDSKLYTTNPIEVYSEIVKDYSNLITKERVATKLLPFGLKVLESCLKSNLESTKSLVFKERYELNYLK